MDRAHDVRPMTSGGREAPGGLRADDLGAVHVVVDDVGLHGGEVGGHRLDGGLVVHLVEGADGDSGSLQAADGRAVRERQDGHVVAGAVHPRHEVVDVLLGAAAAAGREQLHDADAIAAGRERQPDDRLEAGVRAQRGRWDPQRVGHARLPVRRTRTRWIGSSTAPHSYL